MLTKLFDEIEAECLCFAFFIDIGDSSHQWTQNDLGMIFEEINLKSKSIGNQFLVFQLLPVYGRVTDRSDNHAAEEADDSHKVEWVSNGK